MKRKKGFEKKEKHWNWQGGGIKSKCKVCGKEIISPKSRIRKYCSRECYKKGTVGVGYWKGKSIPETAKKKMSLAKIGIPSARKGRLFPNSQGKNHPNWKGDKAGYIALHAWVRKYKGTPQKCEHCGTTEKRMYHWANVDHKYRRRLKDYIRLCVSCHRKYDFENNGGKIN